MKIHRRLALLCVALLFIVACGNKGDLVLPEKVDPPPESASEQ